LESIALVRFLRTSKTWLLLSGGTLREQVLRGGFWLVLSDALTTGAGIFKVALVARLLAPGDFGLFGIALVVQRLVEAFTETGVMSALIQKRGDVRPYLDTAWTLQFLRGMFVCLFLVLIAPFGGRFFGNPQAVAAIRCVGLSTLLWGMINPAVIHLRRDLRFDADVAWRFAGPVTSLVAAVPAAYYLRNAWALILALIAGRIAELLASYCIHPYRPRFRLPWQESRELMRFGRWISVSNMVTFIETQIDSLVIGRFLGAAPLGYYQVALQFTSPCSRLGTHIGGVLFPAMSKLDLDAARRQVLLSGLETLSTTLVPLAFFATALAEPLVGIVLGPQWGPAVPMLQVLVWAAVARTLSSCTAPLLMSIGRPRKLAEAQLAKLLILGILIYLLLQSWGAVGVAWAMTVSCVIAAALQLAFAARAVHASQMDLIRSFGGAAVGCLPVVLGAISMPGASPTTRLFLVGISLVGYSFAMNRLIRRLAAGVGPRTWKMSPEPAPVLTPDSDEGTA
jgi:O-antigen/teichoic acid export membrane protein